MGPSCRKALYFVQPYQVEVREEPVPDLSPDQVRVQTRWSAVSAGSELLFYRGQAPEGLPLDESIDSLSGEIAYPLKYGYSVVGRVVAVGADALHPWQGRQVFAYHPHESLFDAYPYELISLPDGIEPLDALFLPNMETAVSLVMDGRPMLGERVVVFGQGIVGLLTTALLSRYPLDSLVTLDRHAVRRQSSLEAGAHLSLDPDDLQPLLDLLVAWRGEGTPGADLVYELSGAPAALQQALDVAGFAARVVVGSWYGNKPVELSLGGRFHRDRIRLISSQVSSLAPDLSGRWTRSRRLTAAMHNISPVRPGGLITHRYPLEEADRAYKLLHERPQEALQVVLTYDEE